MNTIALFPRRALIGSYLLEAKFEFLRCLRTPSFSVPTVLFPPMFYLLFALLMNGGAGGLQARYYLLATYCVFGVMAPGLFAFGVGVALERERGWLALKRVAAMPPGAYLGAKMTMAMLFALIIFLMLACLSTTLGGVRLAPEQWLGLAGLSVLGVLPFCALGLLIGTLVNAQAAPAIVNLIYLPMAFLSGLWIPLRALPSFIQQVAPLWPSYHLSQLTLLIIGQDSDGKTGLHVAVLAAITIVLFFAAQRRLQRAV